MIEVTCGACGTTHRFAESDVPPGGRAATCTACKAKLQVPGPGAKARPLTGGPSLAAFDSPLDLPDAGGGTGDIIDLAELPAPKRASPLAGASGAPAKAVPKSALAGVPSGPAKPATPSALDLGDINLGLDLVPPGVTDLPAPVGPAPTKNAAAAAGRLPPIGAPKLPPSGPATKTGLGPGLSPAIRAGVKDPPAVPAIPKPPAAGVADLPAPKRTVTPATGVPAGLGGGVTDLPAPKRAATPPVSVPAGAPGITDLPAPKRAAAPSIGTAGLGDLPAPKRAPASSSLEPAGPGGIDLPAPKGFFDDLPAPAGATAKGIADLPAPKGFFDDLPAPAGATAKGIADLPAPKGFFDDLPAPAGATAKGIADLPAPKGFFDDLPAPAGSIGAPPGDLLAPKGFFDDIPAPAAPIKSDTHRPGKPLDLDDLELAPHSQVGPLPGPPPALDLEPMPEPAPSLATAPTIAAPAPARKAATTTPPASASGRSVPALELPDAGGDPYGGLDLPHPSAGPRQAAAASAPAAPAQPSSGGVSFKPAAKANDPVVIAAPAAPALDLDIEAAAARARTPAKPSSARKEKDAQAAVKATSARTKRIALVAALLAVGAGAGGFLYYKRLKSHKHAAQQLEGRITEARNELASGAKGHWDRAAAAANVARGIDPHNTDATAIAAEASYAAVLDDGTNAKARTDAGGQAAQALVTQAANSVEADKALSLQALADGTPDRAAQRLGDVLKRAPNDGDAMLYLGWAHLGAHAWTDAVADFDHAVKAAPAREVPAIYGRAQAKLALGDRDGARADFEAVLAKDHDHVGAQVGLAAAAAAQSFEQRDSTLSALLARKDIGAADPRAVALAWTLWGDDARLAGRLDAAGERYKHALDLDPQDQAALIGQSDLELRGGRVDVARDLVDRALKRDADDVDANLLAAQIDLQRKQLDDAMARLDKLAGRQPPIAAAAEKARLLLLRGAGLEAQGKLDDALDAYKAAAEAAGDSDVSPTIAAVQLLARRAADADKAKDAKSAAAFRQQSEDLLAPLAAKAQTDPSMSVTLGVAYLQSGAPDKAEPFFAAAVAARPNDVEALFQLATAQAAEGKKTESLATRQRAFDADPSRLDVGGALAHDYEDAGLDAKAGPMYDKLVANSEVTPDIRARAGRFWARTGDVAKARAQGAELLKIDPDNAAGLYLQGEGLLADGKLDDARKSLKKAFESDAQAQYYDAYGRACEASWRQTEDSKYVEEALRAYANASNLDAKMFNPLLGRGRLLVERADFVKALEPLDAARALQPDNGDVAYNLGVALRGTKRDKEAAAWLVKSNQIKPRAEAYKLLGEIYADGDQAGAAADALARAVSMALAQEKQTGQPVDWLTDVLYEQFLIANSRNDLATVKRAGQMFLDRNGKDQVKINEVRSVLLGIH